MPKRYRVTRMIDATPETIWALLTDAAGYPDWNESVLGIEGRIEKGSTITLTAAISPKRAFTRRVATFAPPRKMVWSDSKPLGLFRGERTFLIDPADGGTAFSMTEVFSGLLSGLITKAIPDMTESFEQFADGLEAAAEAA